MQMWNDGSGRAGQWELYVILIIKTTGAGQLVVIHCSEIDLPRIDLIHHIDMIRFWDTKAFSLMPLKVTGQVTNMLAESQN